MHVLYMCTLDVYMNVQYMHNRCVHECTVHVYNRRVHECTVHVYMYVQYKYIHLTLCTYKHAYCTCTLDYYYMCTSIVLCTQVHV